MSENEVLFDEVGTVTTKGGYDWIFRTEEKDYSYPVCSVLDELLNTITHEGDKFRIIIEKVED